MQNLSLLSENAPRPPFCLAKIPLPWGAGWVGYDSDGAICALTLLPSQNTLLNLLKPYANTGQLTNFQGFQKLKRPLTLKVPTTAFRAKVYQMLLRVQSGNTISYGALAHAAGHPKAARAVGTALAHNPIALLIPCHRVVPKNGGVGHFAWGANIKASILEQEHTQATPMAWGANIKASILEQTHIQATAVLS